MKKKVVDFGLSPNNPPGRQNFRVKLYCYFYSSFVVKEYNNEGEKGAEWLALAPIPNGATPSCVPTHSSGEKVIDWHGYFRGAKRHFAFFDAEDGTNGGMPFVIYDVKADEKIFEDSAYDSRMWNEKVQPSPFNQMRVNSTPDGWLSLKYLRVVEAGCDLHTEKAACWKQVTKRLGLNSLQMPFCTGYEKISTRWTSAVAYPVQVSRFPQPRINAIPGPVKCWPVD